MAEVELQQLVDSLCSIDAENAVTVITSVLQARPELAPPIVSFAVPDLTYPPSKALIENRLTGTVKSFQEDKGFGFIACEELFKTFGNDVFLHHSQLGSIPVGSTVSFAVMLSKDNKPQGYDLQIETGKGAGKDASGKGAWDVSGKGAWGGEKGAWSKGKGDPWGMDAWSMAKGDPWGKGAAAAWDPWGMAAWGEKGAWSGKATGKGKDATAFAGKGKSKDTQPDQSGGVVGENVGTIKSFSVSSGYGFIDCPELKDQYGHDVFLHGLQVGNFNVGDQVQFTCFLNASGKPQAKELQAYGGAAAPAAKRAKGGW